MILVVVPAGLKRRYDEFGLKLPALTEAVVAVNEYLLDYGWLALPVLVGGIILVAGAGSYVVRHHVRSSTASVLWWLSAFAPPVMLTGVIIAAAVLPEMKLLEGLSK
jgi:type II secretory pathway component PulF